MSESYEVIVVGLGAAGSAATYHLAKRGRRVLGIDMFEPGHDWGSTHGYHRKIRRSSHPEDGYNPLAERAFELWHELEEESGRELLTYLGEVRMSHVDQNSHTPAERDYLIRNGFWEDLSRDDLEERFPGFRLHDGMVAAYEARSGFLRCEEAVAAHLDVATRYGATIHHSEEVTGWDLDGDGVRVETDRGTYHADRLVITTGPWASELLSEIDVPLRVERTVNGYFEPSRPDWWYAENGAPNFLLHTPEGTFYGTPALPNVGLKIGRSGGSGRDEVTTPRTIRRTIDDSEIQLLRDVLDRYLPGASGTELRRITCMCTYSPDKHFIIDRHPASDRVSFACGFSGSGFKLSCVTGEILSELASDQQPRHDISFLSLGRFRVEEPVNA